MVIVIVLSVFVWLSIPLALSRAMARRGYDGGSYLVMGALFGPVAVVFAVMDVLFSVPEPPRILQEGWNSDGDLSVLVVVGREPPMSPPASVLAGLKPRLRRLGLAQVLPHGGPLEDERRAHRNLRQAAMGLGHPELILLFGRPDEAISKHAVDRGYDIVWTSRPDPLLSARLNGSRLVHWCGDEEARLGAAQLLTTPWFPSAPEAPPAPSAASPHPARTS